MNYSMVVFLLEGDYPEDKYGNLTWEACNKDFLNKLKGIGGYGTRYTLSFTARQFAMNKAQVLIDEYEADSATILAQSGQFITEAQQKRIVENTKRILKLRKLLNGR